ncbi:MAG: hypothetical protein KDC71_23585, partial [Acidobacteria bacterium]|nr:hypothetical protein [Acidobacteriota bacterium]
MQIEMLYWTSDLGWTSLRPAMPSQPAHLVLYFGQAKQEGVLGSLLQRFPQTPVVGCTSAGEILDWEVMDNSIAACAIWFEKAWVQSEWIEITSASSSHQAGRELAHKLAKEELKGVLVLSEGLNINGSELVKGLRSELGEEIPIVGGLAGDGSHFEQTRVGCSFLPRPNIIAAVGFFGPVVIGHGSVGGWDAFGPKRIITKSEANILYELDGKPALDLYKVYLAEDADKLPASALLFPLNVYAENAESGVV